MTMPLDPEEQLHLIVAQGFVELGMYLEADADLDPGWKLKALENPELEAVWLSL